MDVLTILSLKGIIKLRSYSVMLGILGSFVDGIQSDSMMVVKSFWYFL